MANKLIIYADSVTDKSLSDAEVKKYQAQGMIFRSLILFDMVRLWGNIPLVIVVAPDIMSENFEEVYPLYFPSQAPEIDVYKQIESDLLFAIQHAPNINPADKTLLTKTVARALLAKVYAEKPIRDYDKVIKYCNEVEADGVDLVDDYTLLFGMNDQVTDVKARNTKGAIWYQGESNVHEANNYRTLFPTLISDWREKWGDEFPFYWVQLANYMRKDKEPQESQWTELREAQSQALSLPKTGQAVTIDIGEAEDIHPRNKQDVGLRLALIALNQTYGMEEVVYSGPILKSMYIVDDRAIIEFENVGTGLSTSSKYGYIEGFSIAGNDKKFEWAKPI